MTMDYLFIAESGMLTGKVRMQFVTIFTSALLYSQSATERSLQPQADLIF